MSHPEDVAAAETYDRYLGPAIADPFTQALLRIAAPQQGERVLDVACGTGSVARAAAPIVGAAGRVVALDVNRAMLAVGRARRPPPGAAIEWREGTAVALDLLDGAFDLVLCQQGLQFFPDRRAAVREMRRVLRGGGRVAISVWQALRLHPMYEALFDATSRHLGVPLSSVDVSFSLSDANELRRLLEEAGFVRIAVTPQSLEVRVPSPRRFVQLTVLGAATTIAAFKELDATARAALVKTVRKETDAAARRYRDGDRLAFPMSTHIALAHSPGMGSSRE